jgi:hypothetical protein
MMTWLRRRELRRNRARGFASRLFSMLRSVTLDPPGDAELGGDVGGARHALHVDLAEDPVATRRAIIVSRALLSRGWLLGR